MFIGHYAVALAAKKATPRTSLGVLFIAAQLLDLIWPVLVVLGVEQVRLAAGGNPFLNLDFVSYPYSHSLLGSVLWGILFGGGIFMFRRSVREAVVIALCVVSHWVLDLFTHIPDLPLTFSGSTKTGLGLWNFPAATMVIESLLFAVGIAVYLRVTRARDRIGTVAFWGLILFLVLTYGASIVSPPPTDVSMIGIAGNAAWLFVFWAWWADRHRELKA